MNLLYDVLLLFLLPVDRLRFLRRLPGEWQRVVLEWAREFERGLACLLDLGTGRL